MLFLDEWGETHGENQFVWEVVAEKVIGQYMKIIHTFSADKINCYNVWSEIKRCNKGPDSLVASEKALEK